MEIIKEIDGYLREFNSQLDQEEDGAFKPSEISSLDSGVRRLQYRLSKANTPQKYKDVFTLIHALAEKFPSKLRLETIIRNVAEAYDARFGVTEEG